MDNLLSGLKKFGLNENVTKDIYAEESASSNGQNAASAAASVAKPAVVPKEEDFLFLKSFTCPVCEKYFKSPVLKSGRARRKEPDLDLRPRFEHIDVNKYDVVSCPKCGFTAIQRNFGPMAPVQVKLIKEGVCQKFSTPPAKEIKELQTLDYDTAIDLYKIALYTSVVKRGQNSEKAYICLKTAWLIRGKMEELAKEPEKNKEAILACRQDYQSFYTQAFDGFVKAMTSERYPMCGMDQHTVDLLIAAMAYNLGKYEYASRFVSELIVSKTAGANIKKRAHDLKEKIVEKMRKE